MALNFPNSPTNNQSFSAGGKTWVYNGTKWVLLSVSLNQAVADGAITTAKIADSAITASKIADGTIVAAEIANNAITTAKILDANVTQAKLGTTLSAVTVTTAANRDTAVASPFTGQLVFLTDTKKIQVWDGTSWLNITMAPPETPTSLSALVGPTSVAISFTAGAANGSAITNYKYALSTNGGSTYGSFIALDPADFTTPITVSGLSIDTAYHVKLKAVNDMGDSVASAAVSFTTEGVPGAPTSLSASNITGSTADISFTPGAQGGSAITNYQYALSTNSGSTYGSFTALDPADATSPITISGLSQGTAYYVKLKAVNTEGVGLESSAVSFTTIATISVQYLVVGGGGGADYGAGGAGGFRTDTIAVSKSLTHTATIGAGGAGAVNTAANGANSVFSTITSAGGGAGGGNPGPATTGINGVAGGSGGGGGAVSYSPNLAGVGGAGNTPSTSPSQGNNGGNGASDFASWTHSGGGGGAGAVGGNASVSSGGVGGAGAVSSITGTAVYYAGGGGGGTNTGYPGGAGGAGGGGAGNNTSGTANTGGGAGGRGGTANGGSGVVILRYLTADGTITIGAGLTGSTATDGSYKVTTLTAGSGNVSWA